MDQNKAEKINWTALSGFQLNLIRFSSLVSVLGIVTSLAGVAAGLAALLWNVDYICRNCTLWIILGVIIITLSIPYLVMWLRLKRQVNNNKDNNNNDTDKTKCS